jgi:hypothetical protein
VARIYNWFERWLKGSKEPVRVEPTAPEPEPAIHHVEGRVASLGSDAFFAESQGAAGSAPMDGGVCSNPTAGRSAPGSVLERPRLERGCRGPTAPGVWVPLAVPAEEGRPVQTSIVLEPGGRAHWHEGELYDQLLGGFVVCAPICAASAT